LIIGYQEKKFLPDFADQPLYFSPIYGIYCVLFFFCYQDLKIFYYKLRIYIFCYVKACGNLIFLGVKSTTISSRGIIFSEQIPFSMSLSCQFICFQHQQHQKFKPWIPDNQHQLINLTLCTKFCYMLSLRRFVCLYVVCMMSLPSFVLSWKTGACNSCSALHQLFNLIFTFIEKGCARFLYFRGARIYAIWAFVVVFVSVHFLTFVCIFTVVLWR